MVRRSALFCLTSGRLKPLLVLVLEARLMPAPHSTHQQRRSLLAPWVSTGGGHTFTAAVASDVLMLFLHVDVSVVVEERVAPQITEESPEEEVSHEWTEGGAGLNQVEEDTMSDCPPGRTL